MLFFQLYNLSVKGLVKLKMELLSSFFPDNSSKRE